MERVELMPFLQEGQITEIKQLSGFRGDHRYASGGQDKVIMLDKFQACDSTGGGLP